MNRRTSVTTALIVANVLAFVYEVWFVGQDLVMGGGSMQRLIDVGAIVPALVMADHQYWRIVSGSFLHGSVLHLGMNMYSLFALGRFVEVATGPQRMAIIYGISLVAAGLAVVYLGPPFDVTVGASGAIFGIFGALFAIGIRLGRPGMRLVRANLSILVLNLVLTFTVPGISKWAHVGGLVAGFVVTLGIFRPPNVVQRGPFGA